MRANIHCHGLQGTISNCTNNYGPYLYPEKFLAIAITNILEGKPIVIHGDGTQVRDWIHAKDHALGVLAILERGRIGETYVMGGDSEHTIAETARVVLRLMGQSEDRLQFVNDRPGQDRRYAMDFSKIEQELGWRPLIAFEDGVKGMIEWYRDNSDWWKPIKESAGYGQWYTKQVERNGKAF